MRNKKLMIITFILCGVIAVTIGFWTQRASVVTENKGISTAHAAQKNDEPKGEEHGEKKSDLDRSSGRDVDGKV